MVVAFCTDQMTFSPEESVIFPQDSYNWWHSVIKAKVFKAATRAHYLILPEPPTMYE